MLNLEKPPVKRAVSSKNRSLLGACLAHMLHDGYTDQLYALLPAWQVQFGLSYMGLAIVRALYYGTMGGLQVSANRCTSWLKPRTALALSTLVAAAGFIAMALPAGFAGLCVGLILAGIGSSVQHPRASDLVTHSYGSESRGALGIYNFAGDLGKTTLPAIVALLLPVLPWRVVVGLMGLLGILVASTLLAVLPNETGSASIEQEIEPMRESRGGFSVLLSIGVLDTATRMGYLLFLPFLIHARGGSSATVGLGLALVFVGGAFGKATCGWLGQCVGVVASVVATEIATAALIVVTCFTPVTAMLVFLPFLGMVLNGTSSVLYGTVPEIAPKGNTGRAFALFYTGVIGAGGLAPIAYGAIADHSSRMIGILSSALTAAAIVPLVLSLRRVFSSSEGDKSMSPAVSFSSSPRVLPRKQ
jgi:MFS transporter, FSR family, fosmidomycin resistance protein